LRDALHDRCTAAVTSAAWSCYTWIHGDGGWDYHILAACAYYLLSTWMIVKSAIAPAARARAWAMGAGAAMACAVHTHLVFAAFVPIAAVLRAVTLSGEIRSRIRSAAAAAGWALAGGVAVTGLFAAVNAATGGRWLFFVPQIEYTLLLSGGNRWTREPAVWIPTASHLVIPCLIVVAGVLWGVSRVWRTRDDSRDARFAAILVLQGFLVAGLMAYLQFIAHQTVLDPSYASYPLYCHVFMMLGALLWHPQRGGTWLGVVAVGAPVVIVAPLLFLLPSRLPVYVESLVQLLRLPPSLVLLPAFAVGGLVLLMLCGLRGPYRAAVFAVSFGLLNAWVTFSQTAYGIHTPGVNRDVLVVIRSLDRYTSVLDPSLFAIRFWREPGVVPGPLQPVNLHDLFDSFLSTRRRSLVTAAYDRPNITAEELTTDDLYTERCLGVLSSRGVHPGVVDRIKRRFVALGVPVTEVGRHEAVSGPIAVALTVLALPRDEFRGATDVAPCPPPR
jgi:hypothetical protein